MESTTLEDDDPDMPVMLAVPEPEPCNVTGLSDSELQDRLDAAFSARRQADASIVRLAGEVVARSARARGAEGLARRNGNADAAAMVAQIGRITRAEAGRLCRVGDMTATRYSLTGEVLPAVFSVVAEAFDAGMLPIDSAHHIIGQLAQTAPRARAKSILRWRKASSSTSHCTVSPTMSGSWLLAGATLWTSTGSNHGKRDRLRPVR